VQSGESHDLGLLCAVKFVRPSGLPENKNEMSQANIIVPNQVAQNPEPATREQDLIRRVQSGERELFYELVRPYERRVYAAALAILHNESAAISRRGALQHLADSDHGK